MIDVVKNHQILTANLGEHSLDLTDPYIKNSGIADIRYGWNVVILFAWLMQKHKLGSKDILEALSLKSSTNALLRAANADVVIVPECNPMIYGGNILLPAEPTFKTSDIKTVLSIIEGNNFTNELDALYNSKFGINTIESKDITKLIKSIDFPIPSVAILLQAMGYSYIVDNPYIQKGIIVGQMPGTTSTIFVQYGKKYKIMSFETFATLAAMDVLAEPLSSYYCMSMNIISNDTKEE